MLGTLHVLDIDIDIDIDVETDGPQFATVNEYFTGRHLTFAPLAGIRIGPDELQVEVTEEEVRTAPICARSVGLLTSPRQKSTASRMRGQVMQWPPPRPRPSSAPTISMTSMPARRSAVLVWMLRS